MGKKWNWKTTVGGLVFVGSLICEKMGWVPGAISGSAEIIGALIFSFFAKDKD